jgi:hypothetical protein
MSTAAPFFCVVMHHERKWTIEATWPDKSVEVVETFTDYFEALKWLNSEASEWVAQQIQSQKRAASETSLH